MLDYRFETSAKVIGYITSYTAVIGTVSGLFVGRISTFYKNDSKLLLHTSLLQFFAIFGLTVAPSLNILILCLAPLSLANAIARVAMTNVTIQRGSSEQTGALLGLGASVLSVARMMAPLVAGVAQEYHVSGPALVGAVFAAVGAAVMFYAARATVNVSRKNKTL